jgi:flagellar biosynthesis/type III secretory pathway M-ring protein FliF/YscJ
MNSGFILNGMGILLLMAIAVSLVYAISAFLTWYRMTNYTVMKTHITLHELQRMIQSRTGLNKS